MPVAQRSAVPTILLRLCWYAMVGTVLRCASGDAVPVDRTHSPSKTGVKRPHGPPYKW